MEKNTTDKLFLTAKDVSEIMSVSQSMAYRLIRTLNSELKASGYLTVCGKVSRKYFEQRVFVESSSEVTHARI